MGKMTPIESATAWGWALEALASSKPVAVSLLHDLIAQIPPNLPADLRRSISERVSLRCLEEISAAAVSPRRADLRFDLSESCEEALKRVMHESAECDVTWKLDIEAFIKHKRDAMLKCALSRIKESIGDGSHPNAELLRRKSGLGDVTDGGSSDGVLRVDVGCSNAPKTVVRDEPNDESGSGSKRSRNGLETENVGEENREGDYGSGVTAKKARWDASYVLQSIMDNLVPLEGSQPLERSFERNIAFHEGDGCVLESQKEVTEEMLVEKAGVDKSKDGCNGFGPERTTSRVCPSHEARHKVSANDSGRNIEHGFHIEVPHPVSIGGLKEKSVADEGRDESGQPPEPTTLHVAPPDKTPHKVLGNESVCNRKRDCNIDITPQVSAEVPQKKNSADGGKDEEQLYFVAMEKCKFLSSECAMTRYSNSKQKDRCLKCNGGGQLLICSTSDCPLVYHESCMGSEFVSYASDIFYCPFCAYCLHLKELLEVKQEALQLRKEIYSLNSGRRST